MVRGPMPQTMKAAASPDYAHRRAVADAHAMGDLRALDV